MWSTTLINYVNKKLGGIPHMFNESPFYKVNSTLRKAGLQFEMTKPEKDKLKKYVNDPILFTESLSTTLENEDKRKLKLRDYQKEIIRDYASKPKNLIFCSRQTGVVSTLAAACLHHIISNPNKKIALFFIKKQFAQEFISKLEEYMCSMDFAFRPGIEAHNKYSFKFENGAEIEAKAYNTHTLKNFVPAGYDWIIFNDCGHESEIKMYFNAVKEYEEESGKTIKVWGVSIGYQYVNHFFELFDQSTKKLNDYTSSKIEWWRVDGRDAKWKAAQIKELGSEERFNQEYECRFSNKHFDVVTFKIPVHKMSSDELEEIKNKFKEYLVTI